MYSDAKSSAQQQAMNLTSFMIHKYYGENDVEAVIQLLDEDIAAEGSLRLVIMIYLVKTFSISAMYIVW